MRDLGDVYHSVASSRGEDPLKAQIVREAFGATASRTTAFLHLRNPLVYRLCVTDFQLLCVLFIYALSIVSSAGEKVMDPFPSNFKGVLSGLQDPFHIFWTMLHRALEIQRKRSQNACSSKS